MKSQKHLEKLQEKMRLENYIKESRPVYDRYKYELAARRLQSDLEKLSMTDRYSLVIQLIMSRQGLRIYQLVDSAILILAKFVRTNPLPQTPYILRKNTTISAENMSIILSELLDLGIIKEIIIRNNNKYLLTGKIFAKQFLDNSAKQIREIDPDAFAALEARRLKNFSQERDISKISLKNAREKEIEDALNHLASRPKSLRKKTAKEIHDSGECDKSTCRLCLLEKEGEIENERTNASGNSDYKNKSEHISATDSGILAKDDSRTSRFQSRQNSSDNSSCESNLRRYNREESLENLSSQEGFQYIPASSLIDKLSSTESKDLYTQCPICGTDFKGKSLEEMEEHGRNCI